jgi:adenylate kinase
LKVIFITGSPGVGKSTLATRLATAINARKLNLGQLALREKLLIGYDRERRCPIIDVDRVGSHLRRVVEEDGSAVYLVAEGHFLVKLPRRLVERIFLLRCHPLELRKRLLKKGYGAHKVLENMWAEILDYSLIEAVDLYGSKKIHEVDTTGREVDEVVEEILAVLKSDRKPSVGKLDWLKVLEAEGELEKLLAERARLQ